MKIAYFDCFSGVAGDMTLAAMIDAGCPVDALQDVVRRLNLPGVALSAQKVKRGGIAATHVHVDVPLESQKGHRHLPQIVRIIEAAGLAPRIAERAKLIFQRLAEAEAAVHNTTVDRVHFHEVGAADAIVDVTCAAAGLDLLGIERIFCSPVPTGHGTVHCEHGLMPVPAPATAHLLRGALIAHADEAAELTTPTGAAIVTTLAISFGAPPPMRLTAVGYGAGTREKQNRPNVLRLMIGESEGSVDETDAVVVLEAQLDDAGGQVVAFAVERAFEAGALDAFVVPIIMKKGRPGQLVTVLCRPADADALQTLLLSETTSFGVRRSERTRRTLRREHVTVNTPYGAIRVKLGRRDDAVVQAWPEYEDCAAAARAHCAPLRAVQQAALAEWIQKNGP